MIWINSFPLPPSVNESLLPVVGKAAFSKKTGKPYYKARMIKTKSGHDYLFDCLYWKQKNLKAVNELRQRLFDLKKKIEADGYVFALRVDCYFVFHVERVFTSKGKSEGIDADNRLKPCWDALKVILGIDDKHFFAGQCEKLTTQSKDLECAIIKISQMFPRTHQELLTQMHLDANPGSSSSK